MDMRAVVITDRGLTLQTIPRPAPGPEQILVKVAYSGLNRADLAMSAGHRHGAAGGSGAVAGLEFSGEVVDVGAQVTQFKSGQRVMCSGAGGYAEYALSDEIRAYHIPDSNKPYSFQEAATLPVALQTMHDAVVTHGQLRKGQHILIQGASSGVGILGMQIARFMGADLVIGSSTNAQRRALLKQHGADLVIDSAASDWVEAVRDATRGQGVDLLIDQVSGYVANDNMRATAIGGRIVNVGRLGGMRAEFDFDLHALRRITYVGVTFRTRSKSEVAAIKSAMLRDLAGALQAREFHLPVDRVFPLAEAAQAQAYLRDNQHFGKVLLDVQS